jgi:hypothetical protein
VTEEMISVMINIDNERGKKELKISHSKFFYDKKRHRQTPFVQQWTLTSTPFFWRFPGEIKVVDIVFFSLL